MKEAGLAGVSRILHRRRTLTGLPAPGENLLWPHPSWRATSETTAPGSSVSATIRALRRLTNAADHQPR